MDSPRVTTSANVVLMDDEANAHLFEGWSRGRILGRGAHGEWRWRQDRLPGPTLQRGALDALGSWS